MTQAALAAVVGVDLSTISTIERGEVTPSLATLWTVADVLAVGLDELVGRRTPNATPQESEGAAARPFQNPWPTLAMLQSQLDEMRSEMQRDRDRRAESAPKRPAKAPRSA